MGTCATEHPTQAKEIGLLNRHQQELNNRRYKPQK